MSHQTLAFVALFTAGLAPMLGQRSRVLSSSIVSSDSGPHEWYTVEADPTNANYLITCGMMWNAKDNADYGFVYSSQDAGKTWHMVLEDKNSRDVSEESCAFGLDGVAYFVADAWKQDDEGNVIWPDAGTTRIWVSHDYGKTWSLGATTGWTDFSSSLVDRNPGPNQNHLYIFFNSVDTFYRQHTGLAKLPRVGDSTGLISYKDGDQKIVGPVVNSEMYKQLFRGTFTYQSLMLTDGSLLTLFWSKGNKETGRESLVAAQHTDPKRESLSDPVVIFRVPSGSTCGSSSPAPAAYDATTNTVYVAYLDGSDGKCKLMLTKSTDDGQTWSPGRTWTEKQDPDAKQEDTPKDTYSSLAFARNEQGVMALLWRDGDRSNCWFFAASTDDGQTYSHPIQISSCSPEADDKYQLADAYLGFSGLQQADESKPTGNASIIIKNSYNFGQSHVSGIAVSADGVFDPVWNVSMNGESQLRTAAIAVLKPRDKNIPESVRTDGWQYKTNKVKFLYGGSQQYDRAKGVLTESIIVRNSGTETLKAPLRLEIDSSSQLGRIYPLGVVTEGFGQNMVQYLDINQYIPGGELTPGRSSAPILLNFHFELNNDAKPDDNRLADISLRLLTKEMR